MCDKPKSHMKIIPWSSLRMWNLSALWRECINTLKRIKIFWKYYLKILSIAEMAYDVAFSYIQQGLWEAEPK